MGTGAASETWATHGLAVKAAFQVGLHSDENDNRLDPSVSEVRRYTWWTCFILDRQALSWSQPPREDYLQDKGR